MAGVGRILCAWYFQSFSTLLTLKMLGLSRCAPLGKVKGSLVCLLFWNLQWLEVEGTGVGLLKILQYIEIMETEDSIK